MIKYDAFELSNGLQVYVIPDPDVQQAVVNILYNVGSRDEDPGKTGFAHLFEHLMFGGSKNISSYDEPLQKVGGENNAFTSTDITNYYLTVPSQNLETGFWLESDRMLSLSFDPNVLEVQRKVVIEEFKQRYLNQPYGDAWLELRPLAYQVHPYQWATIGKEIGHIENATMDDVKSFFYNHYAPNNAIMVVAGNVTVSEVEKLANKWFGTIDRREIAERQLPKEPPQTSIRRKSFERSVPQDAIYKTYHMPGRFDESYVAADLASDVLGRSKSSRLHTQLVKERQVFSQIQAYVTGSMDPGLLVISGYVSKGTHIEEADAAIEQVVRTMLREEPSVEEIEKVKNQAEATVVFSEVELLNKAMNLAFYANGGNAEGVNQEAERIRSTTRQEILTRIGQILIPENSSTLLYKAS